MCISALVDRLSPARGPPLPPAPLLLPLLLPSGPSAVPQGGKRAAPRVSSQSSLPGDPSFPPAAPSPPRVPFVHPLPLPAPGWALSAVSSPPESPGGRAGGCSPPPPAKRGSPRRGHPGAAANRPPPPACAICRLSAPPSWLLPRRLAASALAVALGTSSPPHPGRPWAAGGGSRSPLGRPRDAGRSRTQELGRQRPGAGEAALMEGGAALRA